jgi:subtilisin family serine protease
MRKIFIIAVFALISTVAMAQEKCFWVFFTDKNDTQFDPYSYFDAKAIERYQLNGADLYDISNYPLNDSYVNAVNAYSTEVFGESRWLNAVGIEATDDNAAIIAQMPFVARVQEIVSNGTLARVETDFEAVTGDTIELLTDQLKRFGGQHFVDKGINGKGLRICVMDGGFPNVDTHPAFKHLRDNNQILKTYNFPNKKEDVYGWSTHGTMVLSCIAGINDKGQMLGLAQGAEFLLARTEIDPEPFKEEVWWAQGAEWADKNGADIINSSLGYGKDRHWTKDMDGTSYVAKAANKAVEKGILICNSAGNEGSDSRWMTIITPADAENVLCVGGIDANLENYSHISFSSYGPTADKRMKPNVVAFGLAEVANPSGDFTSAYGTSFSSPLTAGFCACAWQTMRDKTALQMKAEIEKSADLYPYFDYAFGYGVPQAAYFTGDLKPVERSFNLVQEKDGVKITSPVFELFENEDVFINVEGEDGVLLGYYKVHPDAKNGIVLKNKDFGEGKKLNVSYNGFYDSCPITGMGGDINLLTNNRNSQNGTFKKVKEEGWQTSFFVQLDHPFTNKQWNGFHSHFGFGFRWMYGKTYKIGMGLGLGWNDFICRNKNGELDLLKGETSMRNFHLRGELFQRIAIRRLGLNWDLGVYGGINATRNIMRVENIIWTDNDGNALNPQPYDEKVVTYYSGAKAMNRFEYGATTRISYSIGNTLNLGVYCNYRLSPILTKDDPILGKKANNPSPWGAGVELEVVW